MPKTIQDVFASKGIEPEDTLAHYGVLGMKWGKRRSQKQLEVARIDSVRNATDTELKTAINRIKLEQEYLKLTAPPPRQVSKGRKIVASVLEDVGKTQAKNYLNKQIPKLLEQAMESSAKKTPLALTR